MLYSENIQYAIIMRSLQQRYRSPWSTRRRLLLLLVPLGLEPAWFSSYRTLVIFVILRVKIILMKMTLTAMMMIMILTIDPRPPSSPLSDGLLLKVDRLLGDPAFETHFFSVSQLCNKILCSCFMLCYVIIFKNLWASSKAKAQISPHSSLSLALAVFKRWV